MFPGAKVFEAVGRYGGLPGLVCLIYAVITYILSKMKGTAEQIQERFLVLARSSFFLSVLAMGVYLYTLYENNHQPTAGVSVTTTNTTTGKLSPIIPNNCGSITIKDQTNTPAEKEKP